MDSLNLCIFPNTLKIQYQNKNNMPISQLLQWEKKPIGHLIKPQQIMTIQQDVFFQIINTKDQKNKFYWCNNLIMYWKKSLYSNRCVFRVLHGVLTGAGRVRPCPCRGLRGRWCIRQGSGAPWSAPCHRWCTCSTAQQSRPKSYGSFQTWERKSEEKITKKCKLQTFLDNVFV